MPVENNANKFSADGLDDDVVKIKINHEDSGLAQFTKRTLPNKKQLENFEEFIEGEAKEEEITESLNEIYQDGKGGLVDVHRLDIKRKHGFVFWFFLMLFLFAGLAAGGYYGYNYYLRLNSDITAMEFKIEGKSECLAGEEFFYTFSYKNNSNITADDLLVEAVWPENFIFLESEPASGDKNNIWNLGKLDPHQSGQVKIKGKIIGPVESANIVLANLTYMPANFSSQFKKEATLTTYIKDLGLDLDYDYYSSALVGEENEIILKYSRQANGFLNNFRISIAPQENIVFSSGQIGGTGTGTPYTLVRPGVWQINQVSEDTRELPIKFKFNKKISDKQILTFTFEQSVNDRYYKFLEKTLEYEVMKSDLNLTLIINGAREDFGIDFGQMLQYSVVYRNKGETVMKDAVIMAVLTSDFLVWDSLDDKQNGKVKSDTISWSKDEIPALTEIGVNQEGVIDFSIKVAKSGLIDPSKEYQVASFVQFTIGNSGQIKESPDNRSNTIVNKIKSDLKLDEQVRYFSEDNIPVGIGPNPPRVGEKTVYRVYWKLSNNLHELHDLAVRVKLPDYAGFEGKDTATVGGITYDSQTREIIWQIGRLPVAANQINAEFDVNLMPAESDRNKILVILPGSKATAVDSDSQANLEFTTKAKTTKLEDDEIGASDGMVQ